MPESPLSAAHLSHTVKQLAPSATLAINERSNALLAAGRRVYKFGLGQSPFPVPMPVVEALRAAAPQKDYLPVRGLRALQEVAADYVRRRAGVTRPADLVLIGPGSKELMFVVQLAYAAELLVPNPSWVSYVPQAELLGRPHAWLPTRAAEGWKLTPHTLDAHCTAAPGRPRLLILNYPNNPTGVSYTADELRALGTIARRHQILVLSDEIYGDVHHRGTHTSIAPHYPEGTIVATGLSKWCGAGGWRLGLFSFPEELRWLADAMAVIASETFTSVSAPVQHAAITAFRGGPELDTYLAGSRAVLGALGGYCVRVLRAGGASVAEPDGGFYLFPDFSVHRAALAARGIADSRTFTEALLQDTGVATLPGTAFGRPTDEFTLRLSYVNFDGAATLAAHAAGEPVDDAFLHRYCPDAVTAIHLLADWAQR